MKTNKDNQVNSPSSLYKKDDRDAFWTSDLSVIEGKCLQGKKVTDLPVRKLDARVPSQGSVLLERVVKVPED